ncbi:hypothetical protein Ancab_011340 [Ancistrocladus abbreviatus]
MEEVEVPQYFLCPITLQIMKDPVTTITGITYDRQSIEHWLSASEESVCPVTKQPLPRDSDLTPNHTLCRLIQAWCVANAKNGVDLIPTPRTPLDKARVLKIIRDLTHPHLQLSSLRKLENLSSESEKNKKCLSESGVADAMVSVMIRCYKEGKTSGLEECLKILNQIWRPASEIRLPLEENRELIESIIWMLEDKTNAVILSQATLLTRKVFEVASASMRERLGARFLKGLLGILKDKTTDIDLSRMKAALRVLMEISDCSKNRMKMIEANVIFDLLELTLELGMGTGEEKKVTELIFSLLSQLCSCADGRARFLEHGGGIAVVSKRLLRVSPVVDDRAVHIFAMLTRFSGTNETLQEMLRVGAVSKLCMVLQADCAKYLKDKAREMLRMHWTVWHNSPCIQIYLFTRYPTLRF